jgi:hypothetical protein
MKKLTRYLFQVACFFATCDVGDPQRYAGADSGPLTNGGQANIAVSNTDPNLFTVPGDRITAINSLDGGLTNQEQTDSGGAILATVSKNRSPLLWKPSAA